MDNNSHYILIGNIRFTWSSTLTYTHAVKNIYPGGGQLCGVPVSLGHPRKLGSMSTKLITIIHVKFLTVIKVK